MFPFVTLKIFLHLVLFLANFKELNASWAIFLLCLIFWYVEANLRRSNDYHRYNLFLSEFLHNRSYPFTKRCVEKLNYPSHWRNRIKPINDNKFNVKSLQDNSKEYKVVLSNSNEFPSCECASRKKNMLLC